jgi:hypothetical protein
MDARQEQDPLFATRGEQAGEAAALALSAVPYVGGPLAEIAKSFVSRRQNRRLNDFLRQLAADLDDVKGRLNAKLGGAEDFEDFAERVLAAAEQTVQQEKLDALRAVFLNTILSSPPRYDRALEIVDLVLQLQPRHLVLLKILADPRGADREAGGVVGEGGGMATSINQILRKLLPSWDDEEIARTWEGLRRAELGSGAHVKAMMTDRGYHQLEGRLSSFGEQVVEYLRHPVETRR